MSENSDEMETKQVMQVAKAILAELKRKDIVNHISIAALTMTLIELAILDKTSKENMALFVINTFQTFESRLTFGMPQKN